MGVPSRYSGKAISGNPIKNDTSTLLNAGNVNPALANNITLQENMVAQPSYGSKITVSVSPTSSGNTGVNRVMSGTVNQNTDGNYISIMLGQKIAGNVTSVLRSSYGVPGDKTNRYRGYYRSGLNTWDHNHIITKGPGAGDFVPASGIDGRIGIAADDALKFPNGEFTSMRGAANPENDTFPS